MALALNIIILLLEARGLYISFSARKMGNFVFYTQLSNMLCALSCLVFVLMSGSAAAASLRYLGTVSLVMTFLVTICVLIPMGGDPGELLLRGNGIYHHVLCPVLCFVSYVFFERHAGMNMILPSVLLTLAYGLTMLYLNWARKVDGPYPFFRVYRQSAAASVMWVLVLLALIAGLSYGVCLIAR